MGSYFTVDYYHSLSDFSLLPSFRLINPNVDIGVWYFLVSAFLWHWLCINYRIVMAVTSMGGVAWVLFCVSEFIAWCVLSVSSVCLPVCVCVRERERDCVCVFSVISVLSVCVYVLSVCGCLL